MKILVIGGVAAGTKAAAKLKREQPDAQVVLYTKGQDISYAGCGLPYYVGGSIETREELIVNTPWKYAGLTRVEVHTGQEATALDAGAKTVTLRDTATGTEQTQSYDKLILAVGAEPFVPDVPGTALPGVFRMRTPDDAIAVRDWVDKNASRRAVVVGGGFIGLEVAENLLAKGLSVTVVDMAAQLMPNIFDPEMAAYVKRQLQAKGVRVLTGTALQGITGTDKAEGIATDGGTIPADLVVLAIGIRPATAFLQGSGLEMFKGTILVDNKQATNLPDVYAVGDCAMVHNALTGKPQWSAMGSTANITGRCLARNLSGHEALYGGCLGTGVVKLLDTLNAGRTGLTEAQAKDAGFDPVSVVCVTDDKAHYYPGADSFVTKLIADRATHKLLGIQVLGAGAVDKMVDIAVTGIAMGAKVEDFDTLDFAYAPPFSTAIHPFVQACYILENKLSGAFETFTPAEYAAGAAAGYQVIDVQPEAKIPGAKWVNLAAVTGPIEGLAQDARLLLVCAKGKRGYFLQNRLKAFGYTNTKVLEGGAFFNQVKVAFTGAIPPEEIKRVKGLGCLQDKRYPDRFNVRVITRNGKITAEEQRVIAEAAERYGSGEVTMTTRLTLEIQCAGAAHRLLQGYHLPVRPAGFLRPERETPRAVLPGLPQRHPAPQVQDRGGRLPQQLRQARSERLGHRGPACAHDRPRQVPRLQGLPGGGQLPHPCGQAGKRHPAHRPRRLQPLWPLQGQVPLRRHRGVHGRLQNLSGRPLGQAHCPRPSHGQGLYLGGGSAGYRRARHPLLPG